MTERLLNEQVCQAACLVGDDHTASAGLIRHVVRSIGCARDADIGPSGGEQWHVLLDPEGNESCLLRARLS